MYIHTYVPLQFSDYIMIIIITNCAKPTEMVGYLNIFANKAKRKLKHISASITGK